MSYSKTNWTNNSTPAIKADNLNKIEQGIYDNDAAISSANTNIGTLTNLTTTEKTNLVGAINEVDSNTDTNTTNIGDLSDLETTAQTDIVSAINENVDNIGDLTTLTTTANTDLVSAVNELDSDKLDTTGTAVNSTKWDNKEQDWATENNSDTWIPVLKDTKMQHTTISSLVKRGIKSKSVSGTPDSNGFIAAGLGLNNIVIGVSNASSNGAFFTPFISTQENRITIKCETWSRQPITNSVSFTVHYIEL